MRSMRNISRCIIYILHDGSTDEVSTVVHIVGIRPPENDPHKFTPSFICHVSFSKKFDFALY